MVKLMSHPTIAGVPRLPTPGHAVSLDEWSGADLEALFEFADWISEQDIQIVSRLAPGVTIATCFFQTSTRTRLSFEAAAARLGGTSLGFADASTTRSGDFFEESLEDTVRVVGNYVDLLVLRHTDDDAGHRAASVSPVPVVSAGSGAKEHPTQGMLDTWMIKRTLGALEGARVGIAGDPDARTTRSILTTLCKFDIAEAVFLVPPGGAVPDDELSTMAECGVVHSFAFSAEDLVQRVDAVTMIPFQLPSFYVSSGTQSEREALDPNLVFSRRLLTGVGKNVHVFHAGPRLGELPIETDDLANVHYFAGVRAGTALRAALICQLIAPK